MIKYSSLYRFDPLYGMRKIQAVNELSSMGTYSLSSE